MSFLLLFILTPPVQSYVPIVIKIVKPIYSWQKVGKKDSLYVYRTYFLLLLLICLIISLYAYNNSGIVISWKHFISVFIISIISFYFRNDKMIIYFIQSAFILLLIEFHWNSINFDIFSKLFSLLIAVSYVIFIFQKRSGCNITQFSSLDILIVCATITGVIVSFLGLNLLSNIWFFSSLFSIWFGLRFVLIRLLFPINQTN